MGVVTSSGGSYFWPAKVYTFFTLTLVVVVVFDELAVVFDELAVVFDFTYTFKQLY